MIRKLDKIKVKGKSEPIIIYEILIENKLNEFVKFYENGFSAYVNQDWEIAIKYLQQANNSRIEKNQTHDVASLKLIERIEKIKTENFNHSWDGSWEMNEK